MQYLNHTYISPSKVVGYVIVEQNDLCLQGRLDIDPIVNNSSEEEAETDSFSLQKLPT